MAESFTPVKTGPYDTTTVTQIPRIPFVHNITCEGSGGGDNGGGGSTRPTTGMIYPRGNG